MGGFTSLEACGCGRGGGPGGADQRPRHGAALHEEISNARLLRGAREGDPTLVRQALDMGANTEARQADRRAPAAAKPGQGPGGGGAALGRPAPRGTSADMETPRLPGRSAPGLTPLMLAARGGHLTCVMALLDARATAEASDEDGRTALHFAAVAGDVDVFKALVLAAGDGFLCDKEGRLPLHYLPEEVSRRPAQLRLWEAVMRNELPPPPSPGDGP